MSRWQVTDHLAEELEGVREVRVRMVAGDLSVTAGDGPARVEVDHHSGPPVDVRLDDGVLRVRHEREGDSIVKRLLGGLKGAGHRYEATVSLRVPAGTRVDLAAVSAPVVCSGLAAEARVKTVSGDVTLDGISTERVDVKTVSGEVAGRDITADLVTKTVSGAVSIVNGGPRYLDAKTVSGSVTLDLDPDPDGTYEVATVSGSVAVRTGSEPNLVVEAASVSGSVSSNHDLSWEDDRPGRRRLRATIGAGGARLLVKTVSGSFRLVERPGTEDR